MGGASDSDPELDRLASVLPPAGASRRFRRGWSERCLCQRAAVAAGCLCLLADHRLRAALSRREILPAAEYRQRCRFLGSSSNLSRHALFPATNCGPAGGTLSFVTGLRANEKSTHHARCSLRRCRRSSDMVCAPTTPNALGATVPRFAQPSKPLRIPEGIQRLTVECAVGAAAFTHLTGMPAGGLCNRSVNRKGS